MNKELVVIGGGISGIIAASAASKNGIDTLLIEKDSSCFMRMENSDSKIHRSLLNEFQTEKELSDILKKKMKQSSFDVLLDSYVVSVEKEDDLYFIQVVSESGATTIRTKTVIGATGSYEKLQTNLFKLNNNLSGFFLKEPINRAFFEDGIVPFESTIIYGSDIETFKLAERLKKASINVKAVITSNNIECYNGEYVNEYLVSNGIPFFDSVSITKISGDERISSIQLSKIDSKSNIIKGTSREILTDSIILSGEEFPKISIFSPLNMQISEDTKGPIVDQDGMSSSPGLYFVGSALYPTFDIDTLLLQAKECGFQASRYRKSERKLVDTMHDENISFVSPERINIKGELVGIPFVFGVNKELMESTLSVFVNDKPVYRIKYNSIKPYKKERIMVDLSRCNLDENSKVIFRIE